jgi:hypothetical protein
MRGQNILGDWEELGDRIPFIDQMGKEGEEKRIDEDRSVRADEQIRRRNRIEDEQR